MEKPYDIPSLYDLITAIGMEGTGVVSWNVQDFVKFYAEHKYPKDKGVKVANEYDLVDIFIKRNSDSNFLIDEFPILLVKKGKWY